MPNIKSFPNNQDVYIGAEDVMKWLHGRTSGVFAADGNASVSALTDSAMAVTVSDGLGWMANAGKDGVVWWIDNEATNGTKLQLNIDPADGVLNRIDRIIVEWKTTNYVDYPEVKVLKGTTSSKATAPALTNNSTVRQISLAKINVAAGTTAITASMITDERFDPSVCGLVTESTSADTSMINAQFEELLEQLKANLQQITAGQILDGSITVPKLAEETRNYINAVNLSDNSDFEHFVAQAGIGGNHGTQAYAGDRWILDNGAVTGDAREDGNGYTNITLNGTIRQIVENAPDVGTAAIEMVSGTADISYVNGEITITSNGGAIKNVRLFKGTYTVDNMPEYQPKGYGAELAECQRYYVQFNLGTGDSLGGGWSYGNSSRIAVFLPTELRIFPSIICSNASNLGIIYNGRKYAASQIGIHGYRESLVIINITSNINANWGNVSTRVEGAFTIAFSADL